MHRKVPAGFGGRLRGKGPHPPLRARDLAAQPIRLQERDSRAVPAGLVPAAGEPARTACHRPPRTGPPGSPGTGPDGPGRPRSRNGPGGPGGRSGPGAVPLPGPGPAAGPSLAALVTITIPFETLQGRSGTPGDADGFGIVDPDGARDLAAAAARHPRTRWCVTALNPDGTAAAHGCVPGRHPPPGRANLTVTSSPALGPDPPPGTRPQDYPRRLGIDMAPVARGSCDHARAEAGYRPSRALRHLVRARSARCTAPGCGLRRPLRPGPYAPLGPGRHHLRMRSRSAMPPSP